MKSQEFRARAGRPRQAELRNQLETFPVDDDPFAVKQPVPPAATCRDCGNFRSIARAEQPAQSDGRGAEWGHCLRPSCADLTGLGNVTPSDEPACTFFLRKADASP